MFPAPLRKNLLGGNRSSFRKMLRRQTADTAAVPGVSSPRNEQHDRVNAVPPLFARIFLSLSLLIAASASSPAQSCSGVNCLVVSQIYGGGGNSGATYKNDFIEIFNRGAASVSLGELSVQYASATGTSWEVTALSGNLAAGQYYLIGESAGAGGTANLPTPDATGSINMSATAGKVALVNSTAALTSACATTAPVIDIVGFGTTSCSPSAPGLSNTSSDSRNANGCFADTLPSSGFTPGTVNPRNTGTAASPCGAPSGISFTPTSLPVGTVDIVYAQTFTATGGNGIYTYSYTGTLPPGLSLSSAGAITGAPNTAAGSPFSFIVIVGDGTLSAAQNYTVTINPVGGATCAVTNTIAQIQGSGNASPLVSTSVIASGIVTALRSNGFYMQMPSPGDGDPATSDGIFVFTSSAPSSSAAVGNSVCVSGTVQEFAPDAGYSTITEIASPTVTQLSTGNILPAPVALTAADFSPNGGVFQREKYEGMRVSVSFLSVIAPTQGTVNEPNATAASNGIFFGVLPGTPRPFREAGVDAFDTLPVGAPNTIPRWDDNPEILRVNTAQLLGGTALDVTTGATVSNFTGVIDYKFGQYTLLTDPAASPAISAAGNSAFTAIAAPLANDLTLGSFNLQHFYDTADDPSTSDVALTQTAFNNRLSKASLAIRNVIRTPDVLALEEVENLPTAQTLAARIDSDAVAAGQTAPGYQAYLFPGNDISGINNAFLVKTSKVNVVDVIQYGKDTTYTDPASGNPALLNDRPPLVLRATAKAPGSNQTFAFTVIANHLRSLIGVNDQTASGTSTNGTRVRAKREFGAEYLANLIQGFQASGNNVFAVGDLNAYQVNDGYVDVLGVIRGNPAPANQDVVPGASGLVGPILTDGIDLLAATQQYSDTFDGTAQVLDHVLFTQNVAASVRQVAYGRVNADFPEAYRSDPTRPERVSDHDPVIAYVTLPPYLAPIDVTAQTATSGSGLSYNRATQIYSGALTVANTGTQAIAGPIQILFTNLSAGVTLVDASGVSSGSPYLTASATPLAPNASVTVTVLFTNTGTARIGYTPSIYSGAF